MDTTTIWARGLGPDAGGFITRRYPLECRTQNDKAARDYAVGGGGRGGDRKLSRAKRGGIGSGPDYPGEVLLLPRSLYAAIYRGNHGYLSWRPESLQTHLPNNRPPPPPPHHSPTLCGFPRRNGLPGAAPARP